MQENQRCGSSFRTKEYPHPNNERSTNICIILGTNTLQIHAKVRIEVNDFEGQVNS